MEIAIIGQQPFYPAIVGHTVVAYNWARKLSERHTIHSYFYLNNNEIDKGYHEQIASFSHGVYSIDRNKKSTIEKLVDIIKGNVPGTFADDAEEMCRLINDNHKDVELDAIIFVGARFIDFPTEELTDECPSVICIPDSVSAKLVERHNRIETKGKIDELEYIIKYNVWKRAEKKYLVNWEEVFVVSESEKEHFSCNSSHDITPIVIPNGVNVDYFQPYQQSTESVRLTYHGSNPGGRSDDLINFIENYYPDLKNTYPDIEFYIVGRDPSTKVEQIATQDPSITVTGFVEDLRPYLRETSVYVCPLNLSGGIKNKILEAMAMGLPVVSMRDSLDGIKEGENGKHFIAGDSLKDLQYHTKELINDNEKRKNIGGEARKLVENSYSWDATIRNLESHLREKNYNL